MTARRDLTVYRGDTYSHVVTVVDDLAAAVDLSDRAWVAEVRAYADAADVLVSFTVDDSDAATGVLVLSLTAAQTATTLSRDGVWDLQGTFTADGAVETLLAGSVSLTKDKTRP